MQFSRYHCFVPRTSPYAIELNSSERTQLEAMAHRYTSPYREVVRARIILYAAEGLSNDVIAARLDLRDTHVKAAMDGGALLAINCDTHSRTDIDLAPYGVMTGRRGWLTAERCINTWERAKLRA